MTHSTARARRVTWLVTTVLLVTAMMAGSLPPTIAASVVRDAASGSVLLLDRFGLFATGWLTKKPRKGKKGSPQELSVVTGTKPQPPPTKSQKEARVSSIRISPKDDMTLESGKSILFSALPVDSDGAAVQGLACEWTTSDKNVLTISKTGEAVGGNPGRATITATVGPVTQSKVVSVVEATSEKFGPPKPKSTRKKKTATGAVEETIGRAKPEKRRHHLRSASPFRDIDDDPLPDDETVSLYNPHNVVGSPPGQTIPGALTPPASISGTEHGNQNFTFALPVVGMSGRGLGVSLALVYNSQVWNKSESDGTWMTYDVDSGWPSPGFRLSFGQIENQSDSFTLTDPDGTRHALVLSSTDNYDTTDGTFIHYNGGSVSGTLYYPDGTVVTYGAGGGGYRLYPTKITDRNGNYITIAYHGTSGAGPQIESIQDTLNRYVNFYYASNGDLITITMPGLTGHDPLQVMRFYYDDLTIDTSYLFDNSINRSHPTTVHALKYVYLPTSSDGSSPLYAGYKFEYSSYGMIYRTTQLRGMTVSSTSTTSAGSVTSEGASAAQTTYNYPLTNSSLTDYPTYTTRTDEWAGRTSGGSAPSYTFATSSGSGINISTVTAPDGTITETHTLDTGGAWDDGLVCDTYVEYGSTPTVLTHTHLDWDHDTGYHNQRVSQIRTTDVPAGLTKATVLSYTSYNNVTVVSERDFTTDGTVSSTELRKTETDYVDSSNYLNRHLLHLPSTVIIVAGGSSTVLSRAVYGYDDYGSSHGDMTSRSDIIRHEPAFDPFSSSYDSSTDYRGNVSSVTTYTDAATPSGSITHASKYDIAGNIVSAEVDCCHLKTFTYSNSSGLHDYSQVVQVTSGNPSGIHFSTTATFDENTSLPGTATDENSTKTEYSYNPGSLRLSEVDVKDSGDALQANATYSYSDGTGTSAYVKVSTKLDGSRYVDSYRLFDGRGAAVRTFGNYTSTNGYVTQDVEYDAMGRAYRASNPYYASSLSATVNPDGFWTISTFDHLGRVTEVTMPRGDDNNTYTTSVTTDFDGVFTTVTDQAGKQRRQKVDALGRVIRLDEPTTSGLGSQTSPNQATSYEYDLLDNLVHTHQDAQNRYFKYDSLSRLIRENQSEQETNSSYDLSDSWNTGGHWTRKILYNSSGLVTDAYDARGVHTTFSYDDLNRVTQISYSDSTPTAHYYYDSQSLPSGAPSYTHSNTAGRLLAMTYGSGTPITGNYFAYDAMGRVVTQKQVTGSTTYGLSYTYNAGGLLSAETYHSNRTLTYSYDDGGRLSQVSDSTATFASSLSYAAHGGLTSETFGNSMVHSLDYNRRLQAKQITLKQNSSATTPLQQFDYGYGEFNSSSGNVDTSKNNGQIGKVTATIGTTAQWNQGFSYDELGRLSGFVEHQDSGMTTTNYTHGYTYDRYGNRFQSASTALGLPAVSSSEIVASTNRFINSGSTPTTYDEAGNILTDTKFRNLKYFYDANGRQSEVKALDNTSLQISVYDCAGQRVQTTAGSVTRTMVYDVFGQDVAEYLGASLDRENIYRGGQLLATDEHLTAAAPTSLTTTPSSSNISLSWSSASGAAKYRVERKAVGESYQLLTTTTSTSTTDSSASTGSAYLYRACSADSNSNCTSDYSNIALGAKLNFTTDATICGASDSPSCSPLTDIKAAHITELRTAINTVRTLAGQSAASYTHSTISAGDIIYKEDVSELRTKLDEALTALSITTSSYTDNTLAGAPSGTIIRAAHFRELRTRSTSGAGSSLSGGSAGGLHYILSDLQGSARAVMNGSSVIVRHDSLPFGEEIGAVGGRTSAQGYMATDQNRWRYALTERDATSGLDHTWFRKYESYSGRWTSPDPRGGVVINPQSLNHYRYVGNDPINLIDPAGLQDLPQNGFFFGGLPHYSRDAVKEAGGGGNSGDLYISTFDGYVKLPILPSRVEFPATQDPEKPCRTRDADVTKDIQNIAQAIGGTAKEGSFVTKQDYPGAVINTNGASFNTVVANVRSNGFTPYFNLEHPGYSFKTEKAMASGLWYHIVVAEPNEKLWVYRGHEAASREADMSKPPASVTIHCHGTDPNGWAHIKDTVDKKYWWLNWIP